MNFQKPDRLDSSLKTVSITITTTITNVSLTVLLIRESFCPNIRRNIDVIEFRAIKRRDTVLQE